MAQNASTYQQPNAAYFGLRRAAGPRAAPARRLNFAVLIPLKGRRRLDKTANTGIQTVRGAERRRPEPGGRGAAQRQARRGALRPWGDEARRRDTPVLVRWATGGLEKRSWHSFSWLHNGCHRLAPGLDRGGCTLARTDASNEKNSLMPPAPAIAQSARYPGNERWLAVAQDAIRRSRAFDELLVDCGRAGVGVVGIPRKGQPVWHLEAVRNKDPGNKLAEYRRGDKIPNELTAQESRKRTKSPHDASAP